MTRWIFLVSAVSVSSANAADFRDCKELFVSPLFADIPDRKPSGAAWDEGSPVDAEFRAKPKERGDVGFATVGPKQQDTPKPAWNTIILDSESTGAWLPVRVGDSISLIIIDRDAVSDDLVVSTDVSVPKSLATTGVAFLTTFDRGVRVSLRVSATDGKRACSGVDETPELKYELPPMLIARPDTESFAVIYKYNRCNVNQSSPACRIGSYRAVYADLNEDKTADTLVVGGPFGEGAAVVYFGVGFRPEARKQIFVGDCDKTGMSKKARAFMCTTDGTTRLVPLDGSTIRNASAQEISEAESGEAESRAAEARSMLRAMYTGEKSYFAEKNQYTTSSSAIGFFPEQGNRYAYFFAARGPTERRDGISSRPLDPVVIGPDQTKYRDAVLPSGLKEAGCPLTFGSNADGEPIGLGVTGVGADQQFIGYALGNVDDDPELDCWSIATFDRKSKAGVTVPAGTPLHEQSDYVESLNAKEQSGSSPSSDENPAVLAIRDRYKQVGNTQKKFTKVQKSIVGMSAEGSQLIGYLDKGELRKVEWTFFGEGGQFVTEMLFSDGQLEFAFERTRSGGTGGPKWDPGEIRYYLVDAKVIWATDGVERTPIAQSVYVKNQAALLEKAAQARAALSTAGAALSFENGKFVRVDP